jgi:hypothetical protein
MKRSKMFLTLSSFALAIAGAAATNHASHILPYYYYQTSVETNNCIYVGVATECSYLLDIPCSTVGGKAMYKMVTNINNQKCLFRLRHN